MEYMAGGSVSDLVSFAADLKLFLCCSKSLALVLSHNYYSFLAIFNYNGSLVGLLVVEWA